MAGPKPPPVPPAAQRSERRAASRAGLVVPVRLRYESVLDFVDTQSMNISRTGMFIVTDAPAPLGSRVELEFSLADGFVLLTGVAEVVRVAMGGIVEGMGVRFLDLDDANQRIIERIVAVNVDEGRLSTLTFDFSRPATSGQMPVVTDEMIELADPTPAARPAAPPVVATPSVTAPRPLQFDGSSLRLVLGRDTVHHFTTNPLANARSGGFVIPTETDVPMGAVFTVEIVDGAGQTIVSGKGKVLTKQDLRIGVRLFDVPKETLARLQGEVAKLTPPK
ncbi:MAG TPA: PilZ domain-containing protein [Polyangia bacterium]